MNRLVVYMNGNLHLNKTKHRGKKNNVTTNYDEAAESFVTFPPTCNHKKLDIQ
jgi:hypothetical protein